MIRRLALAVTVLLSVLPPRGASADLLADPRFQTGARSRLDQFIRRGVDPEEAEAIFRRLPNLDAEPWVAAWSRLAEPWERKAAASEAQGATREAEEAYRKAALYYSIAKFPVVNHPAKRAAYRKCIENFLKAARYFDPPLERVAIPFEAKEIIGYLRVPRGTTKPPVVIATGGIDVYKEDREVDDILGLGFAAFSMDMPGAGESPLWYAPESDRIYTATIDYLQTRPDVDARRLGFIGRSYGGYWGGRMAYVEPRRIKAAIQWGGPIHYTFQEPWLKHLETEKLYLWSLLDSMIYAHHVKDLAGLRRHAPSLSLKTAGMLDRASAPLLGINGKDDPWISIDDIYILAEGGAPKALRVFPGAGHMGRGAKGVGQTAMAWLKAQLAPPAVASASASLAPSASPPPTPVRVALFGGEPPPLFVIAQKQKLFEKFGASVTLSLHWTSQELREGLAVGRFDIVHSLADNAVAVAEDLGVPVTILVGNGGRGGVHLIAQPHIASIEALRGRTVLVDSPDTGHALALRKMLRMKGLDAGRDYTMVAYGQTQKRIEAMKSNRQYAATMAPFDEEARRSGFRSLGNAAEAVGRYQVSGIYARKAWVEAHADAAVGYLAGYFHATRWARDPANKAAALEALGASADPDAAARAYARAAGGDPPEAVFDVQAFTTGLALRAEIEGTWGGRPPPPDRYYDLTYARRAIALLDQEKCSC